MTYNLLMPFFSRKGIEIHPEITTTTSVAIDLNDGVVAPLDSDHKIEVLPPGSTIKLLDTDNGPLLKAYSFYGVPIAEIPLRPGTVNFGVVTNLTTGTQIVDPETEIRVK